MLLGYKPVQHVTVLNTVGYCNTVVSIIILYYNIMGPPSCMRSVADRNVVMRRMTSPPTQHTVLSEGRAGQLGTFEQSSALLGIENAGEGSALIFFQGSEGWIRQQHDIHVCATPCTKSAHHPRSGGVRLEGMTSLHSTLGTMVTST